MVLCTPQQPDLLFPEVIPEVCDSVFPVTNQLCLGLCTVEFFAFDVGEDSGNLTVWYELVFAHFLLVGRLFVPPSSLAMTSAFPSYHDKCIRTCILSVLSDLEYATTHGSCESDGAAGVSKGNTDGEALAGAGFFTHCVIRD